MQMMPPICKKYAKNAQYAKKNYAYYAEKCATNIKKYAETCKICKMYAKYS